MAGKRDRNLRQGDMAEDLGNLLLRQFCAVAPTPRTEDFGVDAVATILRTDGRWLSAEDSFMVQFKARSVRSIHFDRAGYDWLLGLALPFFVARVDVRESKISIHSTHWVVCRPDHAQYNEVTMYLDKREWSGDNGELHQFLGPPVVEYKLAELRNDAIRDNVFRVMKTWSGIELRCQALRPLGIMYEVNWQTNECPNLGGWSMSGGDLTEAVRLAESHLVKMSVTVLGRDIQQDLPLSLESLAMILLGFSVGKTLSDDLLERLGGALMHHHWSKCPNPQMNVGLTIENLTRRSTVQENADE